MDPGRTIVIAGALLAAGFLVSLVATRLRLPALVLFLGLGMAIGTDGADWIDFASRDRSVHRRRGPRRHPVRQGFPSRERLVLGWAGLRGAVPVVLATSPVIAGVPRSKEFFDIVFFAVLVSTLVQGATVEPVARALRLVEPVPGPPAGS